ncbi:MAG TPA: PLP-dependent aminotransferase family protein, partial [Candidatus Limnocylindria bacterium]|nr:PLP-dependent aminotransferase family protein [Candidatus Limnocylindria bacterium]
MNWNPRFAQRTALMRRSTIRELLKLAAQPGIISFAAGLPPAELFPAEEFRTAADAVLRRRPERALQYGETAGEAELRDWIAGTHSLPDRPLRRENVLITTGSQQGLDLIGRVFLDSGDRVWVENPTYLAALTAWRPYGAEFTPLAMDEGGLLLTELDRPDAPSAKLLYSVPNFQNPTGVTLETGRRRQLVAWSRATGIPLVEDNPYGELRYEGEALPPLLDLDREGPEGDGEAGQVIHLGTFSKTLAPGLRVGWVIAPSPVIDKLTLAKQSMDLHTSTLCQHIALELARDGVLERHLPRLRAVCGARRDAMLQALTEHMPAGGTWSRPAGGMFLFLRLPEQVNATALLTQALARGVAFVPGEDFHANGGGHNTLRLNFTGSSAEQIGEGVRRLAAT